MNKLVIQQLSMKATILAVGTELTTGQITNKNASWISKELSPLGIETSFHLTVPDDKKIIIDALNFCENFTDILFVTGGLGPTSDDFTRDLIADWVRSPLEFDEASWEHVQNRLTTRGFTVKDIQRQQCYFPKGSQVLTNSNGTANGFHCTRLTADNKKIHIFVLPGPPREIEAIWKDHVQKWLKEHTFGIDKKITLSWDTLGLGESDVAVRVEEALKGKSPQMPLEIGYRVHLPYVEVKLTYPESTSYTSQLFVQKVEAALADITILRDFQEVTDLMITKIKNTDFAIYDFVSNGFLHHRLSPNLKKVTSWMWKDQKNGEAMDSDFFSEETNFLALLPASEFECIVLFDLNGRRRTLQIEAPMKSELMSERRKQYFAEMAMVEFVRSN